MSDKKEGQLPPSDEDSLQRRRRVYSDLIAQVERIKTNLSAAREARPTTIVQARVTGGRRRAAVPFAARAPRAVGVRGRPIAKRAWIARGSRGRPGEWQFLASADAAGAQGRRGGVGAGKGGRGGGPGRGRPLSPVDAQTQRRSATPQRFTRFCLDFNRDGRCERPQCPLVHDASRIRICARFLAGACRDPACPLSHNPTPERMPTCLAFLRGMCTAGASCPYRHVRVSPTASLCVDFLAGHCSAGDSCPFLHSWTLPGAASGRARAAAGRRLASGRHTAAAAVPQDKQQQPQPAAPELGVEVEDSTRRSEEPDSAPSSPGEFILLRPRILP